MTGARARTVRFAELTGPALAALRDSDLAQASAIAGVELTSFFISQDARWLWQLRLDDIARDPAAARWIARAVVAEPDDAVIGAAGFHGPPDEAGMVEVSYQVDVTYRRRGYARAMLAALLDRAAAEPGVRVVRAAISPGNAGSLATIAGFGFTAAGEQWDEIDGRELLFEVQAGQHTRPAAAAG